MSCTLHTTLLDLCAVEVGQDDVWTFWTVDEEYRTRYYRTRFQDAYDFLEIIGCEERQDFVDNFGPACCDAYSGTLGAVQPLRLCGCQIPRVRLSQTD